MFPPAQNLLPVDACSRLTNASPPNVLCEFSYPPHLHHHQSYASSAVIHLRLYASFHSAWPAVDSLRILISAGVSQAQAYARMCSCVCVRWAYDTATPTPGGYGYAYVCVLHRYRDRREIKDSSSKLSSSLISTREENQRS